MTRIASGNQKCNVYLDARVIDALRKIAAARQTTYSELVREACRDFVLKEGPEVIKANATIKELSA